MCRRRRATGSHSPAHGHYRSRGHSVHRAISTDSRSDGWVDVVAAARADIAETVSVGVIAGARTDADYWAEQLGRASADIFGETARVRVRGCAEEMPLGNFLGTIRAWQQLREHLGSPDRVSLVMTVLGEGRRLSPFTQALGNRKSAFPTPLRGRISGEYVNVAGIAALASKLWLRHLQSSGFVGVLFKWGDEAIIPERLWAGDDFRHVDAVKFVAGIPPTETLAREKDWVAYGGEPRRVRGQVARQPLAGLRAVQERYRTQGIRLGVNLGSVAVSSTFLDCAAAAFGPDFALRRADWDPYAWTALLCHDRADWEREMRLEADRGQSGLAALEAKYPEFPARIWDVRAQVETRTGRQFAIGYLDFGERPLWLDFGLHLPLRLIFEGLLERDERSAALRELFQVPRQRDRDGNTIVGSRLAAGVVVRNSLIIDSELLPGSRLQNAVVVGTRASVDMQSGGTALFCSAERLEFVGGHGIALLVAGQDVLVRPGDRVTTISLPEREETLRSNEAITDYAETNYGAPVLGNTLSFAQAAALGVKTPPFPLRHES